MQSNKPRPNTFEASPCQGVRVPGAAGRSGRGGLSGRASRVGFALRLRFAVGASPLDPAPNTFRDSRSRGLGREERGGSRLHGLEAHPCPRTGLLMTTTSQGVRCLQARERGRVAGSRAHGALAMGGERARAGVQSSAAGCRTLGLPIGPCARSGRPGTVRSRRARSCMAPVGRRGLPLSRGCRTREWPLARLVRTRALHPVALDATP